MKNQNVIFGGHRTGRINMTTDEANILVAELANKEKADKHCKAWPLRSGFRPVEMIRRVYSHWREMAFALQGGRDKIIFFAVKNLADADDEGFVTDRVKEDSWYPENPEGWTYQGITGAHGTIVYEGASMAAAYAALKE